MACEDANGEEVWRSFRKSFEERRILSRLRQKVIAVQDDEITFDHAWKNHQWHCIESVSFDLMEARSIKNKAHNWLGRITSVKDTTEDFRVYFLVGEPRLDSSRKAFEQALNVLHKIPVGHEIIREYEAEHFAADMAAKIAAHDAEVSAESEG